MNATGIHFYTVEEIYENHKCEQKLYEAALDAQREREAAADEEAPRVNEGECIACADLA